MSPCLPNTSSIVSNSSCLHIPLFPMDSTRHVLSMYLNDLDATTGLVESYIRMESLISTLCAALTNLTQTETPEERLRLERVFLTYESVERDLNEAGITSASMLVRKRGIILSARRGLDPAALRMALTGVLAPANDVWHEVILARTREEFFDLAARLAPRQLACSFSSLTAYADWKYRPEPIPYETPDGEWSIPSELSDWMDTNVRGVPGKLSYPSRRVRSAPLGLRASSPGGGLRARLVRSRALDYSSARGLG
ncbi:RepA [Tecoma stans associated gemykolovirus]|nr:RepA [Tecoma stans associated gemykolovirus]